MGTSVVSECGAAMFTELSCLTTIGAPLATEPCRESVRLPVTRAPLRQQYALAGAVGDVQDFGQSIEFGEDEQSLSIHQELVMSLPDVPVVYQTTPTLFAAVAGSFAHVISSQSVRLDETLVGHFFEDNYAWFGESPKGLFFVAGTLTSSIPGSLQERIQSIRESCLEDGEPEPTVESIAGLSKLFTLKPATKTPKLSCDELGCLVASWILDREQMLSLRFLNGEEVHYAWAVRNSPSEPLRRSWGESSLSDFLCSSNELRFM